MATRPNEDDEDDTLDLDQQDGESGDTDVGDDDGDDGSDDDDGGSDDGDQADGDDGDDDGDDDALISFDGDESAQLEGNDLVKHLRAELREARREAAEARKARPVEEVVAVKLREKPTMADHAYDEEAFAEDLGKWQQEKREIEEGEQDRRRAEEASLKAWNERVADYETRKSALPFKDVDDAETVVSSTLSVPQQALIIQVCDEPEKMIYALGKNPAKLKELAGETNMLMLAKAVINLERNLTVTKRNRPAPDKAQRGQGGIERSDKRLERLEKEAERTGDRTALIAYRKTLAK